MKPTNDVMRINNKRIIPFIEKFYALLFLALLAATTLIIIPIGIIVNIISPYLLIGIILLVFFLLYILGHQHVEYDSDGEVINIRTKDVFWSKYFPKQKIVMDFPKNKLVSFKIKQSGLKKTLEMYVTSKRTAQGVTKLRFNITFLTKSETNDLKRSLNKIVKNNKELAIHIEEAEHDE